MCPWLLTSITATINCATYDSTRHFYYFKIFSKYSTLSYNFFELKHHDTSYNGVKLGAQRDKVKCHSNQQKSQF